MNITRPDDASLLDILAYITRRAAELGTSVVESEVIGALPGPAAFTLLSRRSPRPHPEARAGAVGELARLSILRRGRNPASPCRIVPIIRTFPRRRPMNKSLAGAIAPLLVTAALAWSLPAQAKPPAAPAPASPQAKKPRVSKLDKLATDLSLTAAQKARIKPIMDAESAQTKAIRDKANAAIEPILTADQKAKFEASLHRGKKKPQEKG